jgi:UMF1 family MFS transporter
MNDRRAVAGWVLYDFANSTYVAVVPATVYARYYALDVVGNRQGEGDLLWGWAVAVSMLVVAATAPVLGAIADFAALRKTILAVATGVAVVATALMATVDPGEALWGWLLAVAATIGAETAFAQYNAYLPDLVPASRQGRLSAYGFACGYLGSAVALGAALPFVQRSRLSPAFVLTATLYGVFALPALWWLPGSRPVRTGVARAVRRGIARTRATFGRLAAEPRLRRFLFGYFFFEDGVNTVVYFSAIFAAHTLGFDAVQVIELFFVVQLSALAGAWALARAIDVYGPKSVCLATLTVWCLVVVLASIVTTKAQFFAVAVLAGGALGVVQAASRTFMATLTPSGHEAEFFGFYALCGKAASVCGPLVFGAVSWLSGGAQRPAILAVGIFFVIGLAAVARVDAGGPTGAPTGVRRRSSTAT